MKKKTKRLGLPLMLAGVLLLVAAGAWAFYNNYLESKAGETAMVVTDQLRREILAARETPAPKPQPGQAGQQAPAAAEEEPVAVVDEVRYLGMLRIPALGLELPVAADWSYPQLKKSPCRYVGTVKDEDLVLMAHNYKSHFGYLDQLPEGSEVVFETVDGDTYTYEVALVEILQPRAIEQMTAAEYPLTLFTCTYGGRTRVTVRCRWAQ